MNHNYTVTVKRKFKYLIRKDYEYVIQEITKHRAVHHDQIRNTGRLN